MVSRPPSTTMDLGGLMSGLAQMLTWPAPLRLRPLAEADVDPLASLIVSILGEFEFEWLATEEQRQATREGKAANLRHSLGLCAADPDHNAFWVLEDSSSGRMAGSVGIRRAAAAGNGTGWGERPTELPTDTSTAELHGLYLHRSLRGKKLGLRLYDTAEAYAKACGYRSIWLESVARFPDAKALYERQGYALIDRIDNKYEDEIMVKSIAPVGAAVGPPSASGQAGRSAAAGALGGGAVAQGGGVVGADGRPLSRKEAGAAAARRFRARKAAKEAEARAEALAARRAEIQANVEQALAAREGGEPEPEPGPGSEPESEPEQESEAARQGRLDKLA